MTHAMVPGPRRRDVLCALAVCGVVAVFARPLAAFAQSVAPGSTPLKIGTIGAGHMGSALGSQWVKAGHPVMFSSRHPDELKGLVSGLGPLAHAGTISEAVAFGDVILIAVPYGAEKQIGQDYATALAAKSLVMDVSNPSVPRDGEIGTWAREKGAALATAELIPGIKLVRAFNAIHYSTVRDNPKEAAGRVGVPMVGEDAGAIAIASALARDAGYEPVIVGPLAMGRYLVPGTPLAGEHTPAELRQIAAGLK